MASLCKSCSIFDKCAKEEMYDECIENDYNSFRAKTMTCEGCFYEDWKDHDILIACRTCIRQPKTNKKDNYISVESEREAYND